MIIGAEISQKKTKSGVKFSNYEFSPYFVYGLNKEDEEYGRFLGTRQVKENVFYCYSYAEEKVQDEAMKLFQHIIFQSQSPVFRKSNLRFKDKKDQVKTEELIRADEEVL